MEGYTIPFKDITNSQNWGWTNRSLPEGIYTLELSAGAGNNVFENGELVGVVRLEYTYGKVIVEYETDPGFYLGEIYFWIGNDYLPEKGYFDGQPGDIYIAAHVTIWQLCSD